MTTRVTRREMLLGTALTGAGVWLAGRTRDAVANLPPSEKLNIAFVGAGGQAAFSLEQLTEHNTAPLRPYHPAYVSFAWRGWLDFGTGAIGDMGIHNAAMAWLGLELGLPQSAEVVATSGIWEL